MFVEVNVEATGLCEFAMSKVNSGTLHNLPVLSHLQNSGVSLEWMRRQVDELQATVKQLQSDRSQKHDLEEPLAFLLAPPQVFPNPNRLESV